ncbi:MAG: carboxypeptidase-like regulatory domain-containing protein [Acidobacteriaceae bacterium]
MKQRILIIVFLIASGLTLVGAAPAQQVSAPDPQSATIIGTVIDVNGGVVPNAAVSLGGPGGQRTVTSGDNGFFRFAAVKPGVEYHVSIFVPDFAPWNSAPITLRPGQYFMLSGIRLRVATVQISVVALTPVQVATQQVHMQEKQRAFGFVPNFYVNYDPDPAPMTAKLKFQLALKSLVDPVTLAGFVINASIYQAVHYPDYGEGLTGYGQRLGSTFAGGYGNVLIGNALLPSVLHQDPRYFYRGTGTTRSRVLYAIATPFLIYGDNGRRQFNFSGIGGDLASGGLANAYYPSQERGVSLVFKSALIGAGGRIANGLLQEFVIKRAESGNGKK